MREFIIKCDGCKKDITKDLKSNEATLFTEIELKFKAFMIDPNSHQEEEMTNMNRFTKNVYCKTCFDKLIEYIANFNEEVSPEPEKLEAEFDQKTFDLQSNEIDGPEAMEKR